MTADIRTGTMGWSYDDWRGVFYERDTPSARMLEQYARIPCFDTVELDTTFYGAPRPSTLEGWAAQTPADFLFSAKVPRAITHERRLVNAAEAALDFGRLLRTHLGTKLGALLLQLPPDLTTEEQESFDTFIDGITSRRNAGNDRLPWVVEFRSPSWVETGVVAALEQRGVAVATSERLDLGGPLRYLRLLGTDNSFARFDERQIDRSADIAVWADRLIAARAEPGAASPLFAYVRNFFEGHSPATIADLRSRLGLSTATPPGRQQMSLF
jgi:uncharacterized protein YecE (DUF72 family)